MVTKHKGPGFSGDLIWYLAYGSNMSTEKFTRGRGIIPLATARVRVPDWILAFNIPGLPYSEPTFTSVIPRDPSAKSDWCIPDVLGVAYLITQDQYVRVLGSEGGGIAYDDIEVEAVPVEKQDADVIGPKIKVRTLGSAMERIPWPKPSRRYMNIILAGSSEVKMPEMYQRYLESINVYEPPERRRTKAGAALFLRFWGPVMAIMEKITNATIREDGYAPGFVIWLVRFIMAVIWFTHDVFFAPLFGRGDGNNLEETSAFKSEQESLLEKGDKNVYYAV